MEINAFMYCVLVSCTLLWSVPVLEAKTVSLNELIAAESKQLQLTKRPEPNIAAQSTESLEPNTRYHTTALEDGKQRITGSSKELQAKNSAFSKAATKTAQAKKSAFSKTATKPLETKKSTLIKTATKAAAEAKKSALIKIASKAAQAKKSAFSKTATKRPVSKSALEKPSEEKPKKLKALLSDLETEASDVIRVLQNKKYKRQQNQVTEKSSEAEHFSLNKLILRDTRKPREFSITELITPRGKKFLSSLKYRNKFQIKSPLKPKKLKHLQPRYKRKNKSVKRQVNNDKFSKQYIPLLRSLSMLFDNVLGEHSGEIDGERDEGFEGRESNLAVRKIPFGRRRNIKSRKSDEITGEERGTNEADVEGRESNMAVAKVPFDRHRKINRFRTRKERNGVGGDEDNGNDIKEQKRIFRNNTDATSVKYVTSKERIEKGKENTSRTEEISKEGTEEISEAYENNGQGTNSTTEPTETDSYTEQEAIITTTTEVPNEAITTTSTTTDNTTSSDVINLGSDTDIPLLPPGDTNGTWGNDTGLSQGSSTTFHRGVEGNITRDHRDREPGPGSGEDQSHATNDEENPSGDTRVRANGGTSGSSEELRRPVYRGGSYEVQETQIFEEVITSPDRRSTEFEGENIIKTRGDEAESSQNVSESIRGGRVFENSISNNTKPLQSKANHEESVNSNIESVSSDRRIPVGDGKHSQEVKETGAADETVTLDDLSDPVKMLRASSNRKPAYVTIIDGYSVARDINGRNKLSEHTIRIHS